MKVSLPCKLGNADAGVEALLDDPKLLGRRPAPPPLRTRQNRNGHYACPLTCQLMRARSHIRCQSGRRGSPDAYDILANGIKLYRYRYRWSATEYVGVLAQEVAALVPEAVSKDAHGFFRVDYRHLGLQL